MNKAQKVIKELRIALGMEVKLEQLKLADGVTVIESDSFEKDFEVFVVTDDGKKIAVPVGEYELEDGRILVVTTEGLISEVKEAEMEVEEKEVEEKEVEMEKIPTTPKKTITVQSSTQESYFSEIEDLKKQIEVLKLSQEVIKPIVHNPETKATESNKKVGIIEFLNNLK